MNRQSVSAIASFTLGGLLCIGGLLSLGALSSCEAVEEPETQIIRSQPDDLPVPQGFRFVRERSYRYKNSDGNFESSTYRWNGREVISKVEDFYRTRLPQHGWELVDGEETRSKSTRRLVYFRDAKRLELSIRGGDAALEDRTQNLQVTLRISPEAIAPAF